MVVVMGVRLVIGGGTTRSDFVQAVERLVTSRPFDLILVVSWWRARLHS